VRDILESAQKLHCGTIVVGRDTFPSYKEMFKKHIGEELVQKGQGFAIWVVE
jgi:K+-sensing histidine kinase KdpD